MVFLSKHLVVVAVVFIKSAACILRASFIYFRTNICKGYNSGGLYLWAGSDRRNTVVLKNLYYHFQTPIALGCVLNVWV